MQFTVNWKDKKTGEMREEGHEVIEADSLTDAKAKFLTPKIKGTELEGCGQRFLFTLVSAKRTQDRRLATPVPENFDLDAFVDELEKEEVALP